MKFNPGDLVTLKSAHHISKNIGEHDPPYNPEDWVGIITEITQDTNKQTEIWGTCMVMWKGRSPVNEFLDHLELVGEAG